MIITRTNEVNSQVSLQTILKQLMAESNIDQLSDLSRYTGVKYTTLSKLYHGNSTDPKFSTMRKLADYFGLTTDQIMGEAPIPRDWASKGLKSSIRQAWSSVPILNWNEPLLWIFKNDQYTPNTHPEWIHTEKNVSKKSFALRSRAFMEPRFKEGAILILDPERKLNNGDYALVALNQNDITVRQVIIDGDQTILKALNNLCESGKQMTHNDRYLGKIIEARREF